MKLKSFLKLMLLWSWIISLPIVLLGGYWAVSASQRYETFGVRYGSGNTFARATRFAQYEYDSIKRRIAVFLHSSVRTESELPVINIKVAESELTKLNSHLPQSGFNYVKGTILTADKPIKIKYRYRGDFPVHWSYNKKSLRIKTSKKNLFNGVRSFNLQAPKFDMQVNNFLSYKLAEQMDLLVPRSELVSVTLNGKRIGTHIFVEQLEEMTLRHRLVMPGDIYRGEIIGKDRYLISGYDGKKLFDVPGFWDKMSVNNHYDEDNIYPIKELIAQIKSPDFEASQKRMSEIMDMETWGRFSAYESLTNTYHFDNAHNWRIYYDPWRQKLVPIVWDATGWLNNWRIAEAKGKAIAPQAMSDLHRKLFQNGDFIRARNTALSEFFKSGADEEFVKLTHNTIDTLIRESKSDPYLRPADEGKMSKEAKRLGAYIERVMKEGTDYTLSPATGVSFSNINTGIRLSVDGSAAVNRLRILFNQNIEEQNSVEAVISVVGAKKDPVEKRVSLNDVVYLSGSEMIIDTEFLPKSALSAPGLMPHKRALTLVYDRGDYDIVLSEVSDAIKSVWVDMGQGWKEVSQTAMRPRSAFENLYNPVRIPVNKTPLIWQGTQVITGVLDIDSPLTIKAGTKVVLGEDASLIIRNKLDVQGTQDAPVLFVRRDGQKLPWGTVSVLGENANKSRLSYCVMDGGSGYKDKLFEYSGMFSVHNVKGMTIDNCVFKNGTIVDDMVHFVYSSVDISDSLFDTCLSDALDIDISDARLNNVSFINSGNDAVDLMSSTVSIINSKLSNSGDKGISVGEGSRLLAVNNIISNNEIGVQVKDSSKAFLYNQTITGNVTGVNAYKKNWRYNGGGEAYVNKSILTENEVTLSAEKKSQITVFDSFIDDKVPDKKWLNIYASDQKNSTKANQPGLLLPNNMNFTRENLTTFKTFNKDALDLRDSSRRGAY